MYQGCKNHKQNSLNIVPDAVMLAPGVVFLPHIFRGSGVEEMPLGVNKCANEECSHDKIQIPVNFDQN